MDEKALKNKIQELINKYNKIVEEEKIKRYNEEMTKKDFILPLFEILGWNVYNKTNRNDNVSAEEKISKKRVDYGFRINGIPKFFLEAKALKEDLDNPKFIEQAINYAWYKGCTWAVLTDFEQIKIFNAEWKTTHPIHNLLKSIACYEFIDRFDELWLLSKESFEQDLLDKEAEKWGKKTKKTPVDKQLLYDFTRFREILSKNIIKLNQDKHLTEEEVDESVQRILDRLIFIRNCEDRELEEKKLWEAKNETKVLKKLREIFAYYDKNYNSKLFTYDPDDSKKIHLCDTLIIDDDILKEIIESLYQTKDKSFSYDFSAIEADVLGNIYEQYLGHILKKSEKRAKLTNGKLRRKEQGIYYTPTYIVDYIVRNTVGELLKKRGVKADELKILDPACGSGSFLIKAFDLLNEYWKNKDKHYTQARFDITGKGLTFTRKVKILENNIFGVDLDKQAVEIAQLNLLLKIAEKGHRLPLLQKNIKCGNSLIDDPIVASDKAFKWEEQFKDLLDKGGFDIIIGNPPYIQKSYQVNEIEKKYLIEKYGSSMGRLNTFGFFIKLGIDLLRDGGRLGFIVPNTILTQDYYEDLRKNILDSTKIESIITFSDLPFKDAIVENTVLILKKEKSDKLRNSNEIKIVSVNEQHDFIGKNSIKQTIFNNTYKNSFNIYIDNKLLSLQNKIKRDTEPLENIVEINQAIALRHDRSLWVYDKKLDDNYKPLLIGGKNINRYRLSWDGSYLKYDLKGIHSCKREDIFLTSEKVLFRRVDRNLIATLDTNQFYALHTLNVMNLKNNVKYYLKYILALFNSSLMSFYYKTYYKSTKRVFSEIEARQVAELPIKIISKEKQESFVKLVDKMLSLNNELNKIGGKKTDERARIEDEIKKTDAEIDEIVYKLYGLTKEEIAIVEDSLKN